MGKVSDGVRKFAKSMGKSLRWPKRKVSPTEQKQVDRWEGEGGSVRDDESSG